MLDDRRNRPGPAPLALASVLFALILGAPRPAAAVAVASADPLPRVHEEYVILVPDEAAHRQHVIWSARLSPAANHLALGLPTPATASVEPLDGVDPGAALHALVAPHELRMRGRPPAPPAPWSPRGVTLKGHTLEVDAPAPPFDAGWLKGLGDQRLALVLLEVDAPADGRVEVVTPAVHLVFAQERPLYMRREPPRPLAPSPAADAGAPGPDLPVAVEAVRTEPKGDAPSGEVVARILSARPGPLLECYERFLDQRPGERAKVTVKATIRPRGDTAELEASADAGDPAAEALGTCVLRAVKAKQFPRMDAGWRLSADLAFKPPREASRRTHVVVIGASRWEWPDRPASVVAMHDFEPAPEDVAQAFSPTLRRSLGLPEGKRLWVSHWLDREERRALVTDVRFVRKDVPAEGEPGTLAHALGQRHAREAPATRTAGAPRHGWSRKARQALGVALVTALVVLLGLGLGHVPRADRA